MNIYMAGKTQFMRYWYWHVGKLNQLWPSITVAGMRLAIEPGVYKPLENEGASVDYCHAGDRVLDLGCGCGINTIFCAPLAKEILAVDISAAAVRNTIDNCRQQGVAQYHRAADDEEAAGFIGKFDRSSPTTGIAADRRTRSSNSPPRRGRPVDIISASRGNIQMADEAGH